MGVYMATPAKGGRLAGGLGRTKPRGGVVRAVAEAPRVVTVTPTRWVLSSIIVCAFAFSGGTRLDEIGLEVEGRAPVVLNGGEIGLAEWAGGVILEPARYAEEVEPVVAGDGDCTLC